MRCTASYIIMRKYCIIILCVPETSRNTRACSHHNHYVYRVTSGQWFTYTRYAIVRFRAPYYNYIAFECVSSNHPRGGRRADPWTARTEPLACRRRLYVRILRISFKTCPQYWLSCSNSYSLKALKQKCLKKIITTCTNNLRRKLILLSPCVRVCFIQLTNYIVRTYLHYTSYYNDYIIIS